MKNLVQFIFISLLLVSAAHAEGTAASLYVCQDITNNTEKELCISKANQLLNNNSRAIANRSSVDNSSGWSMFLWSWAWWIFYYGFGLLIGFYIFRDAKSREWVFLRIRPIFWLLLAAFNPVLTLLAYWAMHYSRFAMSYSDTMPSIEEKKNEE